ncbi:MAG: hypothetical protein MUE69_27825, partial [Myxococcota bacterium]|nr:hypothetical protein [Myxococcota bacterium]
MRSTRLWVLVGALTLSTFGSVVQGQAEGDPAVTTTADGAATDAAATDAAAATTTSAEPMDAGTYAVRLRDLEQRINELKEQIFRSKARLSLLAETVLQGVVAGAQAIIVHENRMSSSYKLVKAVYALDGAPIFNRADEEGDSLSEREEFQVYNGSIVPGEHTLTVNLEYRGHGYGIFSYLKGYRFSKSAPVSAPHSKIAVLGKRTREESQSDEEDNSSSSPAPMPVAFIAPFIALKVLGT